VHPPRQDTLRPKGSILPHTWSYCRTFWLKLRRSVQQGQSRYGVLYIKVPRRISFCTPSSQRPSHDAFRVLHSTCLIPAERILNTKQIHSVVAASTMHTARTRVHIIIRCTPAVLLYNSKPSLQHTTVRRTKMLQNRARNVRVCIIYLEWVESFHILFFICNYQDGLSPT
jgi:hypothetical protein